MVVVGLVPAVQFAPGVALVQVLVPESALTEVGGHVRLLQRNLQRPGAIFESGLPIKIAMADSIDVQLTPGELVDIVLAP